MAVNIQSIMRKAEKEVDHVQINHTESNEASITINNNAYQNLEEKNKKKYQIKVWKSGVMGYSYSNELSDDLLRRAIKICKANKKLDYFFGIPKLTKASKVTVHNDGVGKMTLPDMIKIGDRVIKECVSDGILVSHASVERKKQVLSVYNSNGVSSSYPRTELGVWVYLIKREGTDVSSFWDSRISIERFDEIDFITRAKRKTIDFLYPKKMKRKVKNVVLKPRVVGELMHNALLSNFNAKNIEKMKSAYINKMGKVIASTDFSITDTGLLEKGINSSPFDFEGSPSRRTDLVKNGIFKSPLHDFNTAAKANTKSTGNASQYGVNCSNILLKGRERGLSDALVVESIIGAHTSTPVTTDFSVKVEHGYVVGKDGKQPIKDVMISGKMKDVIKNIISMGSNVENYFGVYSGDLVTDKINVVL